MGVLQSRLKSSYNIPKDNTWKMSVNFTLLKLKLHDAWNPPQAKRSDEQWSWIILSGGKINRKR